MLKKSWVQYLALFCIHVVIVAVAFQHFWDDPRHILFVWDADGLKNIFTLVTYVKEPITADGILKYNTFQYPFGDYVYYTDNVPLFSIPFRWICHHVYDLSAYTIQVLYVVIMLNVILCGLLLHYILKRLVGSHIVPFIMAVILPWANMMLMRIWAGHSAFSFSSIILLCIVLMMQWHKHRDNRKRQAIILIAISLLSFFGFMAQGYYLAICTLFSSSMLFFYGLYYRKEKSGRWSMAASVISAVLSLILVMGTLKVTDKYLAMRPENATGYDWMQQKVKFSGLFSHYNIHTLYFPICRGIVSDETEMAGYLGNVGLFALLIFGVFMIINVPFRNFIVAKQKEFFRDPVRGGIFLGALVMLSVSFGEHYYTLEPHDESIHLVNILNPFFYIHQFTRRVEQFRALERFVWPFFFVFNIWMIYNIVAVAKQYGRVVAGISIAGILFLGGWEVMDFVRINRYKTGWENIFNSPKMANVYPKSIQAGKYQSILPIPFYSLGAENYDYNMCDNDWWSNYTYRLSVKTGLPIMACKMSRTPLEYNLMLLNMVAYDSMDTRLKERLNDKPILVVMSTKLQVDLSGGNIPRDNSSASRMYTASLQFAGRNKLQAIDSADDVVYYEWYPKGRKL